MRDDLFGTESTLSPRDINDLTGLGPDMQRDWRRRGYLDDLGEQGANGRWLCNWQDALHIHIMRALYDGGIELPLCRRFASTLAFETVAWRMVDLDFRALDPSKLRKFSRFYPCDEDESGWRAELFQSLDEIEERPAFHVADCAAISRSLPKPFNAILKEFYITLLRGGDLK